jgi:predicted dehydrogenase
MKRGLVVGLGRMGTFHAKVLRDFGYEVVTVDPDPSVAADFFDVETATADRYRSFGSILPAAGFDVAAVACPPGHLLDTAYRLAGVPKLLVEKPFATSVRDAHLLAAYLDRFEQPVAVGLVERFNPQVLALKGLKDSGALGRVRSVHFVRHNPRPSWDEALDLRLHDVDIALWLRLFSQVTEDGGVTFDTASATAERVRTVEVVTDDQTLRFDLMEHGLSPLHGLWHAFLSGGDYPTPADAIAALEVLPRTYEAEREEQAA